MTAITICDVGPRDGLQNEPEVLDPKVRADLCNRLAAAGLPRVEAVSFVRGDRVPQMDGAEDVVDRLQEHEGTTFAGLVLNEQGYDRLAAHAARGGAPDARLRPRRSTSGTRTRPSTSRSRRAGRSSTARARTGSARP